ncbi:MAG: CHAT domain-containing protein [Sterolibacteriaceae bacterium]|nr:CHAT domain-containing protein [Sterolibacteriaceae bacterium]
MARAATPPKPATSKARISGAPLTGEPRSFCDGALILEPSGSFRPAAARDVTRQTSDQALADDQLVEIELEGGITLWTSYAQLREDFPSTDQARAAQQVPADTYVFPDALSLGDEARGLSDWAVKAWRLLSLRIDEDRAAQLTARGLAWLVEHRIDRRQGLHRLDPAREDALDRIREAQTAPADLPIDASRPLLVFLHGTATGTAGSFAGLWETSNRELRQGMVDYYGDNIFALEHLTLSQSPIRNALDLARALPQNARLHLLTHSRGGLVGELLARAGRPDAAPFDETDLAIVGPADAALLAELREVLLEKRLRVERFVRVACPARGTSLASGRLDRYLSVIVNVLKFASLGGRVPLAAEIEDLIGFAAAVVQRRSDPSEFPGLEAMMPESRLIRMLNRPDVAVSGDLTVIAGDAEPQGVLKRLAVLLTDLYYAEEHDFVVNTANMVGGAGRTPDAARMFMHKHGDVSHFRYFINPLSCQVLLPALTQPTGFAARFAPITRPALPAAPARGGAPQATGPRPVVFVLPGIMGSALAVASGDAIDTVWMDFIDLARGALRSKLPIPDRFKVVAVEPLPRTYGHLIEFLGETHEVVPFAYDWRISLEDEARRLADRMLVELDRVEQTNQPIRILAHSMGGLLMRALLAFRPEVWQRICRHPDARVLMLGTPTRGSHSITSVFAGQEALINMLAAVDFCNSKAEILATIARFSGVLELLPDSRSIDAGPDEASLLDARVWREISAGARGGVTEPDAATLEAAAVVRHSIAQARFDPARLIYVAGRADETPIDFAIDNDGLSFVATNQGDGRVPWKTGIPADAATVYYLDAVHGDMADARDAFAAFIDILQSGKTGRLSTQPPADARGLPRQRVMPVREVQGYPDEETLEIAVRGGALRRRRAAQVLPRVRLSVRHGDLRYARNPIVVGHYFGDAIVSAEYVLDRFLDHRLSTRLQLGLYPGHRNTAEVFINRDAGQPSAVVIGLGAVGELSVGGLTECFAAGVLRYAAVLAESGLADDDVPAGIAALLIGTGGGGLEIEDSLTGLLRGLRRAIEMLASSPYAKRVNLRELEIIELYQDRAIESAHTLRRLAARIEFRDLFDAPGLLESSKGGRTRVSFDQPGGWWHRLQIVGGADGGLRFVSLTQRARAEAQLQSLQRPLVDRFLQQAIESTSTDDNIGSTLFELLLPNEIKEQAPDQTDLVLVVAEESARYPWELLRDRYSQSEGPMVVQRGVLRQLQTSEYRRNPVNCRNDQALVVGDPLSSFAELPGAQKEAQTVARLLQGGGDGLRFVVTPAVRENARTILQQLMARDYRILHLAGHGVFEYPVEQGANAPDCADGASRRVSGMVIGDGVFLTAAEVRQMRQVPELVFINCCHLGRVEPGEAANQWFAPHRLAANLAVEFIRMGVRAVIAAGWEVNDQAAHTFAGSFYAQMLAGERFGEAIKQARRQTWQDHGGVNTWGAYQCYGDPEYRLGGVESRRIADSQAGYVSKAEVQVELENLASRIASAEVGQSERFAGEIARIEQALPPAWRKDVSINALLGRVYWVSGDFENALRAYGVADQGELTPADSDRYANAAARRAEQLLLPARSATVSGKARRPDATARQTALDLCNFAVDLLARLLRFKPTVERYSMMGSAQKRLALLQTGHEARRQFLRQMAFAYSMAARLAREAGATDDPYPLINAWTALIVLGWQGGRLAAADLPPATLEQGLPRIEATIPARRRSSDFWERAVAGDCALLRLIARHDEANATGGPDIEAVARAYLDAAKIAVGPREWNSVLSQIDILQRFAESAGRRRIAGWLKTLAGKLGGHS